MKSATVHFHVEPTIKAAIDRLHATVAHMSGSTIIFPSSLVADDVVAAELKRVMHEDAQVCVPVAGAAARRAWLSPTVLGDWRDMPISVPGAALTTALVPGAIARASHRIVAVDVVEVARGGPFVLDVAARYVHPRHRVRLVMDNGRAGLAAEVASAVRFDLAVIALILPQGAIVATTTDPIAGELVALALSERCLGTGRSFTGPWEDAVVQRATELDMGVRLPDLLRFVVDGVESSSGWASDIMEHTRRRLGMAR